MRQPLHHPETPGAHEALELLPWYVNGTLEPAERRRVEAHLATCAECREEAEWLRGLRLEVGRDAPAPGEHAALARALERIDALESGWGLTAVVRRIREGWGEARPWLRMTVLAQLAAIVVLAVGPGEPAREPPAYRTLSAPSPAGAGLALWITFDPAAPEEAIRTALVEAEARVVDGPLAAGVFVVEVAPADAARALRSLRRSAAVRFVERAPGTAR